MFKFGHKELSLLFKIYNSSSLDGNFILLITSIFSILLNFQCSRALIQSLLFFSLIIIMLNKTPITEIAMLIVIIYFYPDYPCKL